MPKNSVDSDLIINFLEGGDPQKYIVGVEATYYEDFVYLIINDPDKPEKTIEKHSYTPFLWVKQDVFDMIYEGKRSRIKNAMRESGIKVKKQIDSNADGEIPDRLKDGYIYLVECKNGSYSKLINFFKNGGVDLFNQDFRKYFVTFSPAEQYLIQTKKRLFKGIEDYNDTHRLQFDLETEGLDARTQPVFQIGIKDNRGFEYVLEVKGDTPKEKRDSERFVIKEFFRIIDDIRPDIITGYNSENFDWDYFEKRCDRLNLDLGEIAITLDPNTKFRRKDSMLKLGGESENYKQTYMWGYNILDISHSVRRAQAINSSIKKWNLKYITQFSDVAKVNRVYIPGDILYKTWSDPNPYWFNDLDGSWGKLKEGMSLPENSQEVKGDYIVQRYLLDDLWETEQIDGIYNQAAYLIAKLLPTTYMRSSTMGTAGQWKLIMAAWSYENGLAIPSLDEKKPFVGGLSRLLEVGYARNVIKLDFAALYPKTQLTHSIFPSLDISGVMEGLLTYIVDTRDKFKFLTGTHKNKTKELRDLLEKNIDKLSKERIDKANGMITDESKLASDYDKKQLPLKILANSFFGAYGAPYIFNWGDTDSAEETTCRGRQYLRLMVKFFTEKYGFRALVMDTDGANFAIPDNVDDIRYVCNGTHWKTNMYEAGTELSGLEAVLAEFNETYMIGRMGLDVDDICNSTINFARKNYANDIGSKIKLVGNSIKSKAMPVYIEEFLDKGIRMLLDGNGYDFIDHYYKTVDNIFNYKIPVAKIASKSKVKITPDNYKNVYCKQKTKAGRVKARQAHMELILHEEINVDLGDVIYYVNTGSAKSHSDVKKITDKETGKVEIQLNCKHIPQDQLENDPNLTTDEYNVAKYLDAFNKRIKPLLVCFDEEIRHDIIIDVYKDRKTKVVKLKEKSVFTEKQCKLIAGKPFNESDQDTYEALMRMEDKEIAFWSRVNKLPNNMEQDEWDNIKLDWKIRSEQEINDSISYEKNLFHEIIQRLEIHEINEIVEHGELYGELRLLGSIHLNEDSSLDIVSNKNNFVIGSFEDLFKFKKEAEERRIYYNTIEHSDVDLYQSWLDYQEVVNSGSTVEDITSITNEISNIEVDAVIINNEYIKEIEDYLINHKWEKGSDNQWVMDDWDYNKTGSITLEDAYELEKIKQKVLTEIKNSKVGDKNLVLKTPIEEEDIVEELEDDEEWNF